MRDAQENRKATAVLDKKEEARKMNVFIDTNILLDFYRISNSDIEELRKLVKLSKRKKIRLFVSTYLVDEFNRQRENQVAESIDKLRQCSVKWDIPNIFSAYPEFKELMAIKSRIEKIKEILIETIFKELDQASLPADTLVADLFASASIKAIPDDIIRAGMDRSAHLRPPGKRGSCGDAVHWEWLLSTVAPGERLILVSHDQDYESPLRKGTLNIYLRKEWKKRRGSSCVLYTSIKAFLDEHFPQIKISDDVDRVYPVESQNPWAEMGIKLAALDSDIGPSLRLLGDDCQKAMKSLNESIMSLIGDMFKQSTFSSLTSKKKE